MPKRDDEKASKREPGDEVLEEDVIVLEDEEGREERFKILFDSLFVGDRQYVVLMPLNDEGEYEPEVVILRVEEMGGGDTTLVTIDDDDEWEEVLKEFEQLDIEENLGDYEIEVVDDEDDDEEDDEDDDEEYDEEETEFDPEDIPKNGRKRRDSGR